MLALDTLISGLVKGRRVFSTDKLYKKFLKVEVSSGIDQLKPVGLWYSIEDSWFNWCSFEKHNDGIKKYIYEIELNPKSNILFLKNETEIFKFVDKYIKYYLNTLYFIDWEQVSQDYDGIEINPYFRSAGVKNKMLWYYVWDVPSGCIWTESAISKVTELLSFFLNSY